MIEEHWGQSGRPKNVRNLLLAETILLVQADMKWYASQETPIPRYEISARRQLTQLEHHHLHQPHGSRDNRCGMTTYERMTAAKLGPEYEEVFEEDFTAGNAVLSRDGDSITGNGEGHSSVKQKSRMKVIANTVGVGVTRA